MPKVQIIHNTQAETPHQITAYVHCGKCLDERPDGTSPKDWARMQIGYTKDGIQAVCTRHNCNVDLMRIQLPPGLNEIFTEAEEIFKFNRALAAHPEFVRLAAAFKTYREANDPKPQTNVKRKPRNRR